MSNWTAWAKSRLKRNREMSDKICARYILLHLWHNVLFWTFYGVFQSLLEWKRMPQVTNSNVFVLYHPFFPRSPSNSILKMKYSFLKPNLISELPELQSLSVHGIHKILWINNSFPEMEGCFNFFFQDLI